MTEPSVCAIMLTANRPEMAKQAVECFRRQTYANKRLLIYDSSDAEIEWPEDYYEADDLALVENHPLDHHGTRKTIGYLRNRAIAFWTEFPIIVHFDDDDISHPNRIAEQVQLLQSSGADAVGYNECLFWREPGGDPRLTGGACKCTPDYLDPECTARPGEAWLYASGNQNEAIGSSLCYWRKTWERKPFQPTSQGEDAAFQIGLKVVTAGSTFGKLSRDGKKLIPAPEIPEWCPRLMCRIHSGNTSNAYTAENMRAAEWRRVVEWDDYCRSEFAK